MSEYIILLIAAIITIPLTFLLISRKKLQRSSLFIVLSGLLIALIATFIGQNFPFYYTILVMFGLAFALSVLLDKRQERKVVEQEVPKEEVVEGVEEESELQHLIKQQEEAAAVDEEDVIDTSTDDDLEQWMSATIIEPNINIDTIDTLTDSDTIAPIEEESRGEK